MNINKSRSVNNPNIKINRQRFFKSYYIHVTGNNEKENTMNEGCKILPEKWNFKIPNRYS